MFRCPKCGQGKEMHYRGTRREELILTMKNTMEEIEEIFYKHTHYRPEAAKERVDQYLAMLEKNQDQTIKCPSCESNEYTLEQWREAKTEPLKYFEMENLCHCGGELWMDQIPGTTSYGFVCDKCNWVKPNAKVSGA